MFASVPSGGVCGSVVETEDALSGVQADVLILGRGGGGGEGEGEGKSVLYIDIDAILHIEKRKEVQRDK